MVSTLSDLTIRNLKPKAGRQIDVRDSRVPGLAVRVSPKGTKTFVLLYRIGRKARRLTLGRFPILRLAEARERARQALRQVLDGKDPAAQRQKARAEYDGKLFGVLVLEFIERYAKPNTRSWHETERLLKREFADWNRIPVHDISRRDVNSVLAAILERGSPSSANHALAAVRKFFNWAVAECHLEASPCVGIRAPSKTKSRERTLTMTELAKIWLGAGQMGFPYGKIVQLLILTGQRRSEVAGMQWNELNLDHGLWAIPAERTKTNRSHNLPLDPATIELLRQIPRVHDNLVFPAIGRNNPVSGFSKWKSELDNLADVRGWRVHDIRRTVASGMAGLKIDPHITELVLNHTKTGTLGVIASVYNRHPYNDEMRAALAVWAEHVAAVIRKLEETTTTPYLRHVGVQQSALGDCGIRDGSWYK